jgi:glycosyltransferase involved in cell wall biosynthesis
MSNIKTINNLPKVTVVTVTYNAEQYLEQTIKSVMEQDYPRIEYIIIDGVSNDGTVDIIKKYEKHIDYWVSEPDSGIYDAMNKGIDVATGEWINFMNAGDSFIDSSTLISIILKAEHNSELLYGDSILINKNEKIYRKAKQTYDFFKGIPLCHQSLFTKTHILEKYKFDTSYFIAGDYDFILKTFMNNHNYQYINIPICNFLDNGLSKKYILKSSIEALMAISKYTDNINIIYNSNPFFILQMNNTTSQNYHFSFLLNKFNSEIIHLKLNEIKFILYGYGTVGKMIHNEFKKNIQMIVDNSSDKLSKEIDTKIVYHPKNISHIKYDKILISVLGREDEIIKYLTEELQIKKEKIITLEL